MKLFVQGKILSRFESSFEDKDKGAVVTKKIQFMETKENGKVVITEVKLDPAQDMRELVNGAQIQMPIKLFTPSNASIIYYSQDGEIKVNK